MPSEHDPSEVDRPNEVVHEDEPIDKLDPKRFRFGKFPNSKLLNDPKRKKKPKKKPIVEIKTVIDPKTGKKKTVKTVVKTVTTTTKTDTKHESEVDSPV